MSIIRKVLFFLVLAGLLTWGIATMASSPAITAAGMTNSNAVQLEGQVLDGVERSPDSLHHVN